MGRGSKNPETDSEGLFTLSDVQAHNKRDDKWIIIDGEVYDITNWSKRHPGGAAIISHYAGQDASNAFAAFHVDIHRVKKYLPTLHVGHATDSEKSEMNEDFLKLKDRAIKMGLFKPSMVFFGLTLFHIIAMETLAYLTMKHFGTGWIPYMISVLLYVLTQEQAGYLQHDCGHLSIFHNLKADRLLHLLTMGVLKGASPHWWNHMHNQHHAKPNVMNKDPDVRVDKLFVVGDVMPVQIAKTRVRSMPYNWQHRYFFLLGPPLLFTVYFPITFLRHIILRKRWQDFVFLVVFFAKLFYLYGPLLGFWGTLGFYFLVRCGESYWFTMVSKSNHIPMPIKEDTGEEWLPMQTHASCNIETSFFNDWFTGHLNHQIEHHLFPQMPRHNLYKIAPYAKEICEKHGIPYVVKPLLQSFKDIVQALKESGELWYKTKKACQASSQ